MAINFPDAPANGATYTTGSTTWTYYSDSTSWRAATVPTGIGYPATISIQNTASTATASGANSMSIGANNTASGVGGISLGANAAVSGNNGIAIGTGSQATAAFAVALGANVTSSTANTIVIGTNTNFTVIPGGITLSQSSEVLTSLTGAAGVVTHDFSTGSIFHHTSPSANFTTNFTNVPTTDNRTNIVTLVIIQGATPYYPNAVQIGGVAQTIKWIGGSAPTATANRTEIVSFTLVRQSGSWTVLGSLTSYG